MSEEAEFQRAFFILQSGSRCGERIDVHFNPASLQYSIANTLKPVGDANQTRQFVGQRTGKLVMELIFDTTHSGQDVRAHTGKLAKLMEPEVTVPVVVQFEWGSYTFRGMVESYRETLDFFAPNGVPLRASVNLILATLDRVFESGPHTASVDAQGSPGREPVNIPVTAPGGASGVGALAGNALAGRAIAAANGLASMRVQAGASLTVSASVSLRGPAAFASGGINLSSGAGGAFDGLRASASGAARASLDAGCLVPPSPTTGLATDGGASFQLGGRAGIDGPASLGADVGASASLRSRIRFGDR
jgi:hypothetical protein